MQRLLSDSRSNQSFQRIARKRAAAEIIRYLDNMIEIIPAEFDEVAKECGDLVPEIQVTSRARERIRGRENANFVARVELRPVGFLIGYGEPDGFFYVYLLGVDPGMRKRGIATHMLDHAEHWAMARSLRGLRTQSRNKYPDMLRLLISRGYNIVRFEDRGDVDASPIRFEKVLSS